MKDGSLCPLQEIKELESQIQNETVVLQDNGTRSLDMDQVIESFKNQYATMAARSREEVEYWNKKKVRKRTRDVAQTLKPPHRSSPPRWTPWSTMQDSGSRKCVI